VPPGARLSRAQFIELVPAPSSPGTRRSLSWTSWPTRTSRHRAREALEDVLDLLAAGIQVISTINVQHLESLNDVIAEVTGIRQRETVPDWVLGLADQVELVDMSPHALRRRMMHGNVYPDPQKAELALRRFFTLENLTALRELALMWVANQVNEDLLSRWAKGRMPETRERVLVCISHPGFSEKLVRRARASPSGAGDLFVLHVRGRRRTRATRRGSRDGPAHARPRRTFEVVASGLRRGRLLAYAYRNHVTQVVVGESMRSVGGARSEGRS
jgi:two-component system sensor histidine kinase KdpD